MPDSSEIKGLFQQVGDYIVQRVRSPFFPTFFVVWVVFNWRLIYTLFTIDLGFSIEQRVAYLERYHTWTSFRWDLFHCAWKTIVVLIITYLLIALAKSISILYEEYLLPLVYSVPGNKYVVPRNTHNKLKEQYSVLYGLYEDKINAVRILEEGLLASQSGTSEEKDLIDESKAETSISGNLNDGEPQTQKKSKDVSKSKERGSVSKEQSVKNLKKIFEHIGVDESGIPAELKHDAAGNILNKLITQHREDFDELRKVVRQGTPRSSATVQKTFGNLADYDIFQAIHTGADNGYRLEWTDLGREVIARYQEYKNKYE
jgi:hypothetical protein